MPELPEVETVVRSIAPYIVGHKILHAAVFSKRVTRGGFAATVRGLESKRIERVDRVGKQIFVMLDRGVLYIHLGMTGKVLWNVARTKHVRATLELDNGVLTYDDIRQFGRFEYFSEVPPAFSKSGPDALIVGAQDFTSRLQQRKGLIKPLLLNQTFISGVGNIYADEALWATRIHPQTQAGNLSKRRATTLHGHIVEILRQAIEHRGSSISNYVDAEGARGGYQSRHNVYGREGEPCPRCGSAIRRIVLAQRSAHFCPRCQRL